MIIDFCYSPDQLRGVRASLLEHGLRELLRAHRMGHHIVILPRMSAQWILNELPMQEIDRSTVFRLEREYAQTADLTRRAIVSIRLRPDNEQRVSMEDGRSVYNLTLQEISQPYTLDRSVLVVEDSVADGAFYKLLFSFAQSKIGIYSTSVEIYHGGGSRTIDVAVERAVDRRIVCAIIDSDKRAPSDRPIPKVDAINRRASDLTWPLLSAVSPSVREVENLVPLSIVKELPCSQAYPHIGELEAIANRERETGVLDQDRFWLHFDVKLGFKKDLLDKTVDPIDSAWLSEKFKLLEEQGIAEVSGFGGNVVEQSLEQVQLHGEFRKAVRGNRWWDLFGSHLSFLVWLCAAPARQYT